MPAIASFVVGFIFAVGLAISGMTLPSKVIGFLDVFGDWDPSLVFVMAGAVVVYFVAFRFARPSSPILSERFTMPTAKDIDARLLVGAVLFGAGWALAGYCPGPALTSIGAASIGALVFVGAMLAGMFAFSVVVPSKRASDG